MGIKAKIISLIMGLIILVTISLGLIFLIDFNKVINKDLKLFHLSILDIKKDELVNKMDLADHIIEMYYQKSTPIYMQSVVEKDLKLKQDMLFSQLNGLYNYYKDKLSEEQLKQLLLLDIKNTRYSNNGYFWVNDFGYQMIMHPIKPEYDGKSFVNTPKVPFVELAVNKLEETRKNQAFIQYQFYNPATKKYEFKVSLVRVFKPYEWIIGTGKYISDVTKNIQKQVIEDIKSLRYGQNGYFWINDLNSTIIMHPIKEELDNKNLKNTKGYEFLVNAIEKLKKSKKDEIFIQYKFLNPVTGKVEDKFAIIKLFRPWGWVIGTGTYLTDIEYIDKEMKKTYKDIEYDVIYKIILISIIVIIIAILLGSYLTAIWIIKPMENLSHSKEYFEEISHIDYLTKVRNRRSFFEKGKEVVELAKQNNVTICALMIDIDFFKKVNDTYGHKAGDAVLKAMSDKISSMIRDTDIFGRLGGEEFAILMLNCDEEKLFKTAEKIRKEIEKFSLNFEDKVINFTISIGAYLGSNESSLDSILEKADELLYKAKNNGRNRVEINESKH